MNLPPNLPQETIEAITAIVNNLKTPLAGGICGIDEDGQWFEMTRKEAEDSGKFTFKEIE